MQRPHAARRRSVTRRRGSSQATRLHGLVFAGGLLALGLGLLSWAFEGGPKSVGELIVVADLTVGGTVMATGSLVGRARSAEARRAAQLQVLQLAARRMSASLTFEDVGRAVVEETGRIIDYHNARVYLLEPPDDLVPVAFEGRVGEYEKVDLEILRVKVGQGLTGWAAQHATAIRVDDVVADPRGLTIAGTDDVDESMLVVPMQHDGRLVGVITLSKLGLRQFDDDDLQLLTILADQAATAFSGAAHLAETRRLAAELRQLLDMSSALSRSLDPHDVASLMAEHLARAVGADEAQISDWDRAGDRIRTLGAYPGDLRAKLEPFYPLAGYPLTRKVLEEGLLEIVDTEDGEADPAEVALLRSEGMQGLVMLPLVAKGEAIGLVELTSRGRPTSDSGRITLVRTMAHEAAMALENARLYETARNLADRDPLTGFLNHRALHERLAEEVVRAVRTRQPMSVLMLDLDDFKLVNDTFGHQYGDRVLVHVADLVRSTIRASDVAARFGGDEFALILPDTDREGAERAGQRILDALQASPLVVEGRQPFTIAASIGMASHPLDGRSGTDLIAVADAGLYGSKDAGGGRVMSGVQVESGARRAARRADSRALARRHRDAAGGEAVTGTGVESGAA